MSVDLSAKQDAINGYLQEQKLLSENKKFYRNVYFLLICLITLFILFFASWMAQMLARQISVPISALLGAAREVRQGNLAIAFVWARWMNLRRWYAPSMR